MKLYISTGNSRMEKKWKKKDTWQSREEAQAFFLKAMAGSEGSEQERYAIRYG